MIFSISKIFPFYSIFLKNSSITQEFGLKNDLNSTVIRKLPFPLSDSFIEFPVPVNVIEIPETEFLEKTED